MSEPVQVPAFLTIKATCTRFSISKSTFYSMLRDTSSGLADVVVRIPPRTGRVRVPVRAFEAWLARGGERPVNVTKLGEARP